MNSKNQDIENLITQAKLNNIKIVELLFKQHYSTLYLQARSIIKDPQQAKDIIQEVFYALIEPGIFQFKNADETEVYLIQQTKQICASYLKANHEMPIVHDSNLLDLPDEKNYEDIKIEGETIQEIKEVFNQLPPDQKELIKQQFYEGKSNEQLAVTLNINRDDIRKKKYLALEKFRQKILGTGT